MVTIHSAFAAMVSERDEHAALLSALPSGKHVCLYGPPGTGKTSLGATVATLDATKRGLTTRPYYMTTATDNMSKYELLGTWNLGTFVWIPGAGHRAFTEGCTLIVNEIDKMSQEAEDVFHALADGSYGAELLLADGSILRPADGFRIIATMNGEPSDLALAIQDRFLFLNVAAPSSDMLAALADDIRNSCASEYANCVAGGAPNVSYREFLFFDQTRAALMAAGRSHDDAELWAATLALSGSRKRAQAFLDALKIARSDDDEE